ncbi:MAG: hypothetical protein IJJ33_11130 [Victivallales bacterium]|nr:hypothetical protein [Victivallales bacterium]
MKIRQNLHLHSLHSCDSACAAVNDLQREMLACGMEEFGLSDHFHTRYNLCDLQSAANDFRACVRPPEFHFGVELTCMAKWECEAIRLGKYSHLGDDPVYGLRFNPPPEGADFSPCLDFDDAMKREYGVEYAIGGAHWPLKSTCGSFEEACEDLFTQMMFLAECPLIDILAHPWYPLQVAHNWVGHHGFAGHPKSQTDVTDYSVFARIPGWMNERLGETLVRTGTCAEVNASDLIDSRRCPSEYRDARWRQLAQWREMGVKFTFGTDQHAAHANPTLIAAAELLLDLYGFKEDDFAYGFPKRPC